jgi:hypothetical protein
VLKEPKRRGAKAQIIAFEKREKCALISARNFLKKWTVIALEIPESERNEGRSG